MKATAGSTHHCCLCVCVLFLLVWSDKCQSWRIRLLKLGGGDRVQTLTERKHTSGRSGSLSLFYLSNIKHHRGEEEDPPQVAPGWLGAGVSGSPSPGGSLSVWTWDKAEPRRSVPAGRCRAGWGPAGTPGGGSKGKPRGRRRSPSRRRERAWWRESRQRSRVRTADTHTEEFTDFKVTQQNKRTLQSLQ